jgi:pilus assembly protein CpaB
MRMVFGLVLIVGLALAGFAVYMVQGYLNVTQVELDAMRAAQEKAGPMVEVFVVNKPLNYGDELTKDDVQKILWQKSALPETIFSDEALLFPEGGQPRFILRQMEKFEPLLAVKVTEPGEAAGLTSRLTKGMRAFAIKVDVSSGVSGFVQPNDFVDIIWTGGSSESGNQDITQLIENSVKVIAVDQNANNDLSGSASVARTVTVEVTPEQVARLAQAQATGRLALSLVGSGDSAAVSAVEVDQNALLGIEQKEVKQVEAEKICSVKERKGDQIVDTPITCAD